MWFTPTRVPTFLAASEPRRQVTEESDDVWEFDQLLAAIKSELLNRDPSTTEGVRLFWLCAVPSAA